MIMSVSRVYIWPKLVHNDAAPLESDNAFRSRLVQHMFEMNLLQFYDGDKLDAIGLQFGLIRGGYRQVQ